ncbi:MAG: hypothetical protein H0W58_07505 [Acidobacteria bacterium]|jgi:transcription elongation factor Elf1|nr:hypothetical protein [Acidobacteriota bacterium]
MKIIAKISVQFDCKNCGEKCETESDYIWIDETKIFRCDFCGASSKIQFVPVEEKEKSDE